MNSLLQRMWARFYQHLLSRDWRLRKDSAKSYNRAKRLCHAVAFVYFWSLTWYDALSSMVQRLSRSLLAAMTPSRQYVGFLAYPSIRHSTHWRTIRLLRLEPGHESAPLVGTLTSCSIINVWLFSFQFDMPPYDALSYCWGGEVPSVPIMISNTPVNITPGLAAALTGLRLLDKARYVWADQICIDQHSVEEKNSQVHRMGEVYANAHEVMVWLGESTDSCRALLTALHDVDDSSAENVGMYFLKELEPGTPIHQSVLTSLQKAIRSAEAPAWAVEMRAATSSGELASTRELVYQLLGVSSSSDDASTAEITEQRRLIDIELDKIEQRTTETAILTRLFREVLDNAWFERAWTLQEAVLGPRLKLYANHCPFLSWRRFVGAHRIITHMADKQSSIPSRNQQALEVIELLRTKFYSPSGLKDEMPEILDVCRTRQAGNSRDKLYSVLGLYSSWTLPFMPAGNPSLDEHALGEVAALSERWTRERGMNGELVPVVDYNKTEEQVFLEAALCCMVTGSLRILKSCCASAQPTPVGTERISVIHGRYTPKSGGLGRPLPSWVTDWSADAPSECQSPLVDDLATKAGRGVDQRYHAAKDTIAEPRIIPKTDGTVSDTVLAVTGLLLSPVSEVTSSVHTYETIGDRSAQSVWSQWFRIAIHDATSTPYGSYAGCIDAFWRVLILDAPDLLGHERASADVGEGFEEAVLDAVIGGELPPGCEARLSVSGRPYYIDHNTRESSWVHPRRGVPAAAGGGGRERAVGHLPAGWEARLTDGGRVYYVDHNTETTCWERPAAALASAEDEQNTDSSEGGNGQNNGGTSNGDGNGNGREAELTPISAEEYAESSKKLHDWLSEHGNRHLGRKLFRTEDGYLGMSCAHVEVGDIVAVLHGGRLPFLLRPRGKVRVVVDEETVSRYTDLEVGDGSGSVDGAGEVVQTYEWMGGECYVHGLADGQVLDMAEGQEGEGGSRLRASMVYIR